MHIKKKVCVRKVRLNKEELVKVNTNLWCRFCLAPILMEICIMFSEIRFPMLKFWVCGTVHLNMHALSANTSNKKKELNLSSSLSLLF